MWSLLLAASASAGLVNALPDGAETVRLLLCSEVETCIGDARWLTALEGDDGQPFLMTDLLLELDAAAWDGALSPQAQLDAGLAAARVAAAEGRWRAVAEAVAEGAQGLERWSGTVSNQDLFDLAYLDGAARLHRGGGEEAAFRHAASIGWRRSPVLPDAGDDAVHAYASALRKLVVAGPGQLRLDRQPDDPSAWFVNGVEVAAGAETVQILSGTHRVTVADERRIRTFRADIPALPERTVAVTVPRDAEADALWLRDRVHDAFDALTAPRAATEVLAAWCRRNDVRRLVLLRVDHLQRHVPPPEVEVAAADPLRPGASAGETVAGGLTGTWEDDVLEAHELRQQARPPDPIRRLRLVYFDPNTQRFSTDDAVPVGLVEAQRPRLAVGIQVGWTAMLGHHHGSVDLTGGWPIGPIHAEVRLGLVRAESAYDLYHTWTDQQLYHALVGARWAPATPWAPFLLIGAEAYAPVAVGGRLEGGVQGTLGDGWTLRAGGFGGLLDVGRSAGLVVGLTR